MRELSHEECSERLEAYASDRLDGAGREEMDAHLANCPDCSLELATVQAIMSFEVEPMTGPERERVSDSVRAAVFAPRRKSFMERLGPRFAPALGAVALVAIAVVALVSLPRDSADEPAVSSVDVGADRQADEAQTLETEAEAPAPAALPKQADQTEESVARGAGGAATGGGAADTEGGPATTSEASALNVRSNFTVAGETFSETGLTPGSLVPARVPREGLDYFDSAPSDLAAFAPNQRIAGRVEECAERTIATSPHPLVPSSAAYYADDVLVIGFVWLETNTSTFNYELRGWVDGDCERISPIYRRGVLE